MTGYAPTRPSRLVALRPYLLVMPLVILLAAGVFVPMAIFVTYGFWQKAGFNVVETFTLDNFAMLIERTIYLRLIGKAIFYGSIASVITLLLAYPLAYLTATRARKAKGLVLLAVLVPLYTSDIVRIFAWRSVLGGNGLINQLLLSLGLVDEPVSWLLFSPFAAILALCHMLFPFMFLAVWAVLEQLDMSLVEAARDLGARRFTVLRRVILPMSLLGVFAGTFFVFIPVTGDYLYINMLGGTGGVTITKAIVQQFGAANNWPFGSAMATTTMLSMFVLLLVLGLFLSRLSSLRMFKNG